MGTRRKPQQSADGSMATMALRTSSKNQRQTTVGMEAGARSGPGEQRGGKPRRCATHEALPHTSPGGKPPETPGPLSLCPDATEGEPFVKGSQAAPKPRALDKGRAFPKIYWDEGKGASVTGGLACLPLVGSHHWRTRAKKNQRAP